MLDRHSDKAADVKRAMDSGIADRAKLLKFLAHRQFKYLSNTEAIASDEGSTENHLEAKLGDLSLDGERAYTGFNGRWNKKADTCYTWWACSMYRVSLIALLKRDKC